MRMRVLPFLALILVALPAFVRAEDAPPAPPTPEQLQQWIKQLGDENFQTRTEAQEKLLKAGGAALEPLKAQLEATQDIEVKNAINGLILRLKWVAVRDEADYLDLFPANTAMAVRLASTAKSWEKLKGTGLGQLLAGEDFKPLLAMLDAKAQGAPEFQLFLKWLSRFNGQVAGGIWALNPMDPQGMGMAAILELPAENPAAVFQEFLTDTGMGQKLEKDVSKGFDLYLGPQGQGALALLKRHLIVAPNADSILKVADGLVEPAAERLTGSVAYSRLRPHLGGNPEFLGVMNVPAYQEMLGGMMGMMVPGFGELMGKLGYDAMETVAMATYIDGPLVEDRMLVSMRADPDGKSKIGRLMEMAWKGATPLKDVLALAPAGSVAAGCGYIEGATAYEYLLDYFKNMAEFQAQMGLPGAPAGFDAELKKLEETAGLKAADLAGAIQGDFVYWAKLGDGLVPPDFGAVVACASPEKAAELGASLEKAFNALVKAGAGKEAPAVEVQQKDAYKIWVESEDSPLLEDPQRKLVPYRACWAVHGSRILMGSSTASLAARLKALDAGEPGYDPAKALPAEAAGQAGPKTLMVLELPTLLTFGAQNGLPLAAAALPIPEVQKAALSLSQKPELFKTLPPISVAGYPPVDGVQKTVIRSPAGVVPLYGAALAGFFMYMRVGALEPPAPGGRAVPGGGDGF
ncbi:MAG: hypothetical protein M5U26_06085 [Planctomycetota bacterium]|nr:hypothetical protein [Planctomycetota bacterium]